MRIYVLANSFRIEFSSTHIDHVFFSQCSAISKRNNNIIIGNTAGEMPFLKVDYAQLSEYDGAPPTGIDDVITDMLSYIGGAGPIAGSVDVAQWNGTTVQLGAGNVGVGTLRVTLGSDDVLGALIEGHLDEIEDQISRQSALTVVQVATDVGAVDNIWVDAGAEIDMTGYNFLTVYCDLDINDSSQVQIKFASLHSPAGDEYDCIDELQYTYEFSDDDQKMKIVFASQNGTPRIQLKTRAVDVDTGGGTIGKIAISIIKSWS